MNKLSKYEGQNGTIEKYLKMCKIKYSYFIGNPLKRIYHLPKLIY